LWFVWNELWVLASVVIIDLVLAGDNAVVVAMAAAGLPARLKRRVIVIGIALATVGRVILAIWAVQLLQIIGLTLAGGILLLWVAWKFYRDLRYSHPPHGESRESAAAHFLPALGRVVAADLSMSLDNVLAIAGTARGHGLILVAGLLLSVALMGAASSLVARLLERYRFLAWIGLLIVASVALRMIYEGSAAVIGLPLKSL